MEIRNHGDISKSLPRKRLEGELPDAPQGIMKGGCILPGPLPPIKIDSDRFEFRKKDQNGDGALSREEFEKTGKGGFISRHRNDTFAKHDLNNDGRLTYAEFKNGRDFDRKDKNNDGTLTSDEYGAGRKNQNEFRRYDTNHDGKVSRQEHEKGRLWDRILNFPRFPKPEPLPRPEFPELRPQPFPLPLPSPRPFEPDLADLLDKAKDALKESPLVEPLPQPKPGASILVDPGFHQARRERRDLLPKEQ